MAASQGGQVPYEPVPPRAPGRVAAPPPTENEDDRTTFSYTLNYAKDVVAFARYLGIDPVYQSQYLWIAEETMLAPMPDNWSEHKDPEGRMYFYNSDTDQSTRTHPLDGYYRSLFAHIEKVTKIHESGATPREQSVTVSAASEQASTQRSGGQTGSRPGPKDPAVPKARSGSSKRVVNAADGKVVVVEVPPITPYELIAMAKYLNIDPLNDYHMLWIAEQALDEPLPSYWEEHVDDEGHAFFYNSNTDESTREHPADEYYFGLVRTERSRRKTAGELRERNADIMKPWMQFTGQMGNVYYFSFQTQSTYADLPHFPKIDITQLHTPKFKYLLAQDGPRPTQLVFYSWYNERGDPSDRRIIELVYSMETSEFRVRFDKGKYQTTTITDRHANPLELWDLRVGAQVVILGKRHTLNKGEASTISFIDYNVRRLEKLRQSLERELSMYELVPDELCHPPNGDKGTVSMRSVMKLVEKIKHRIVQHELRIQGK